jgi:putative resolvase
MNDNQQQNCFLTMREAVKFSALHPQTIRKYADKGVLKCFKTPTGQRKIDKEDLQRLCSYSAPVIKIPPIKRKEKKNYIYSRVSSKKQLDDLSRQTVFIQSYKPEYASYISITDVASGINFKRKGLQTILDSCLQGTVGELVISHRDRLCRFGFELLQYIVEKNGGNIIVIDDERHKSSEQELAEDLLSIVHIYSCRQMGKRSYNNSRNNKNNKDKIEDESEATQDP